MRVDDDARGRLDGGGVDLRLLDRGQVHAGLDPMFEENRIERIGRAQHDVGARDRLFRLRHGDDVEAQHLAHARGG